MKAKISGVASIICVILAWGSIGAMDNGAPLSTLWWTALCILAAIVFFVVAIHQFD